MPKESDNEWHRAHSGVKQPQKSPIWGINGNGKHFGASNRETERDVHVKKNNKNNQKMKKLKGN